MNEREYTYKELQEMLPDYIFNQLTISEAKTFENQISKYPDLIKEVEDSKLVFSKIDKLDITDEISSRSRNLSVKVNQKVKHDPKKEKFRFMTRLVLPTAALAVIVAMIFLFEDPNFNNETNEIAEQNSFDEIMEFSTSEKLAIIESSIDENLEEAIVSVNTYDGLNEDIIPDNDLKEMENKIIEENVNNMKPDEISTYITSNQSFGFNLMDDLK
jgi:hypothetical protein